MVRRAIVLGLFILLFTASTLSADYPGLGSNVTGTWVVKISTLTGKILGVAELTQNGSQVTGWFESNGGDRVALSGALVLGKLVITTHPETQTSRRVRALRTECRRESHEGEILPRERED